MSGGVRTCEWKETINSLQIIEFEGQQKNEFGLEIIIKKNNNNKIILYGKSYVKSK